MRVENAGSSKDVFRVRFDESGNYFGRPLHWAVTSFKAHSDRAKVKENANMFFDVCRLFFDLFCLFFDPFRFRLMQMGP